MGPSSAKPLPTIAYELVPEFRVLIACFGVRPVGDPEWETYLELLTSNLNGGGGRLKCLVVSGGGVPSPSQRSKLFARTALRHPLVAVVTDSIAVHFVLSVMALVHADLRSFLPAQTDAALDYLSIPVTDRETIRGVIARLRIDLENPDCYAA